LRQPDLVGKCAAAGDDNRRPAPIVSLHRIQAIDEAIRAGQAAAQFENNHVTSIQ